MHLLIKMHENQAFNVAEDENADSELDLDEIIDCLQLILPFCEESLTIPNNF